MSNAFRFEETSLLPEAYQFRHYMERFGVTKAQAKQLVRRAKQERIFVSDKYQANLTPLLAPEPFGSGTWISLKRLDKEPLETRGELGAVMRALTPGHHGFELFPAPRRLVDSANQFHCWALSRRSVFESARLTSLPDEPTSAAPQFAVEGLPAEYGTALVALDLSALPASDREDWRVLQAYKERVYPGCEAALLHLPDERHPLNMAFLVIRDPQGMWPFGFSSGLQGSAEMAERMGARQRAMP